MSAHYLEITVRPFARYAELFGRESFAVRLEAPATVRRALDEVRAAMPNPEELPDNPMVALNHVHVHGDAPLHDGDELALLPPLAGG